VAVLRVLVAGAGAVGSMLALRLARAGARVTLAEPGPVGRNASGVAAGMLAPVFESVFDPGPGEFDLLMRARGLWPDLAQGAGINIDRSGAMAVGSPAELDMWEAALRELGAAGERHDEAAARERSPWLAQGLGGLWTAQDWRLDSVQALHALQSAARREGVEQRNVAVEAFQPGRATLANGERIDVDRVVLATGATRGLTALAPELSGLRPIKGHILRMTGLCLTGPAVRYAGGYICPDPSGAVIGATMETGRDDDAVEASSVLSIRERAARALPAALTAPAEAAVGVRAATQDRKPLVRPSATPGVWLAVGARRNGWLLAPLIAETVTRGLVYGVVQEM